MDILYMLFIIFVVIIIGVICFSLCHMVWSRFGENKNRTPSSEETQLPQPAPSLSSLTGCNLQTNPRISSQYLQTNSTPLLWASNPSDLNCSNQYGTNPCREQAYTTSAITPLPEPNVRIPLENNQLVITTDDQPPSYAEATGIK
ncbi:hypothetical protein ILUMI_03260 [Ignelater luminosus]|uniref:Uncharacterized protein n=1 Tax=Ignelater luminosus TaxID=2038154 RepID=A0A8K0DBX4_IGNLU|nr:hypothetical protein ILUMI_03260 [Ignelater luminosus]